jgi:hypothetical protein
MAVAGDLSGEQSRSELVDQPNRTDRSDVGNRPQITKDPHRVPGWSHHWGNTRENGRRSRSAAAWHTHLKLRCLESR